MVSGPEALVDGFMPQASGKGQRGPQGKGAAAATTAATPTPKQTPAGGRIRERKFENGDRYRGGWLNLLVSSMMKSPLSCSAAGIAMQVRQPSGSSHVTDATRIALQQQQQWQGSACCTCSSPSCLR